MALIAGGHTFGKTHGAGDADLIGPEPEGAALEEQGLGWRSGYGSGKGRRHDHLRPRGHLDRRADPVEQPLLRDPLRLRVGAHREPGRRQAVGREDRRRDHPRRARLPREAPPDDAHLRPRAARRPRRTRRSRAGSSRTPTSSRWPSPRPGTSCCTATWVRSARTCSGPGCAEPQLWQDPVPAVDHELVDDDDVAALKAELLDSGLSVRELVETAWASAATFRRTDKRGGANGARVRLEPQRSWEVNDPEQLAPGADRHRGRAAALQRVAVRRQGGLAGRPDRARRLRRGREGRARRRRRGHRAVHARPHRRHPGADRRRVGRLPRSRGPTGSATIVHAGREAPARDAAASTGPTCSASPPRR